MVIDVAGDEQVRRGDTVEFAAEIQNVGDGNAVAVEINQDLHPHLDLDSDSIQISPIAVDDDYIGHRDQPLSVDASSGLLSNDRSLYPVGGSPPSLAVNVEDSDSVSDQGGSLDLNDDGSFQYTPPSGYEGSDSFSYTLESSDGLSDTATVDLQVIEPVIYVSNRSDTGVSQCDSADYENIGDAVSALSEGLIFICAGDDYIENVSLQQGQRLVGQGEGLVMDGNEIVPPGDRPVLRGAGSADAVITMLSNSEISGLTVRTTLPRAVQVTDSSNIRIHNNRFEAVPGGQQVADEPLIDVRVSGSSVSGRVDITDNPFIETTEPAGSPRHLISVQTGSQAEIWGEISGNGPIGNEEPWVEQAITIEARGRSTLVMRIEDNEIDSDMAGQFVSGISATANRSILHMVLAGNHVRLRGDGGDLDFIDGILPTMNSEDFDDPILDFCINFGTNNIHVQDANLSTPEDASEYFINRFSPDFPPMQIQDLGGDDHDSVENHIQLRDERGTQVRVLTTDDNAVTFPAQSGSFTNGVCMTPEDQS
ncbi:Ig-like domain-containing protein [Gammaproteobacteria bacterium AB-CW1]|uniref:Ig-like domain-containing protein n=1 Tax=Natronospira elongata TaxID=3110268 RepID=A0AAP6JGF5_9GAMM|nr:Ig-like domain-containing protein [Gammaproteobacteria bacterium AB-CW1]